MHIGAKISMKDRYGFTLLELLVVVAIIGFLSSVSILALSAARRKEHDQQRRLDQITIIKAAELYTSDFGVPPAQMCVDADNNGACDSVTLNEPTRLYSVDPFQLLNAFTGIKTAAAFPVIEGGGDGGSGPVCGNGIQEDPQEQCDDGNTLNCDTCNSRCYLGSGNQCGDTVIRCGEQCDSTSLNGATCETLGFGGGTLTCSGTCTYDTSQCQPLNCNGNQICEPQSGENYDVCPSDCSSGGSTPGSCGNGLCNAGETPGNCAQDCTNISMCYVAGQWNLCCAFGTNCTSEGGGTLSGYYGLCHGDRCEVKYMPQRPTFTCSTDVDCVPHPGGGPPSGPNDPKAQDLYVPSSAPNWLRGMEPYLATLPKDPGNHSFGTGHDELFDKYYVSSHPDIVGTHIFCAWVSYQRVDDNFNPYNDLNYYPTGSADADYWTPLCIK